MTRNQVEGCQVPLEVKKLPRQICTPQNQQFVKYLECVLAAVWRGDPKHGNWLGAIPIIQDMMCF